MLAFNGSNVSEVNWLDMRAKVHFSRNSWISAEWQHVAETWLLTQAFQSGQHGNC